MKNKKFLISMFLIFAMLFSGCGNNKEATEPEKTEETKTETKAEEVKTSDEKNDEENLRDITFVLDWTPNTNHTGLYVAQKLGFYKEVGLNVNIVQPPEDTAESLVGTGRGEFGVSFQDYLPPLITGDSKVPIVAIAAIQQHNNSGIMSRKGEGMDRPRGMEGKKYATWDLPVEKGMIKDVVEADGGDFDKIQLIPSTVMDEVSALKSNSVDAIWVYYGWGGIAANVAGLDIDYFAFKDINDVFDYYSPIIITSQKLIDEEPELVRDFLSATEKGYEYAIENPKEAAEILLEADSTLDRDLVMASQEWISKEYKAESDKWGVIDPKRWNAFYEWLNQQKFFDEEIPLDYGFTNEFLQ